MSDIFDPRRWKPAPLLPRKDPRDGALVFVVAVLCFLACLTAIGGLAADRAARGWTGQLTGSATVVVRAIGGETPDTAAGRAAEALSGVKGVTEARALEKARAEALLEPWLGREALLDEVTVVCELTPEHRDAAPEPIARELQHRIKTLIGVSTRVQVGLPDSVERTLVGKARRVVDKRPK